MNQIEVMKQALEDLKTYQVLSCIGGGAYDPECADLKVAAAMDKVRQAIEQAEKGTQNVSTLEPVAWMNGLGHCIDNAEKSNTAFAYTHAYKTPLYLHPPTAPAQPAVELKPSECWPEDVMQQWDWYRKLIASGDKGSEPRDWFESLACMRLVEAPAQQPLTTKQIAEYLETATLDYRVVSFIDGVRFSEKHHGIKGASL